MVEASMIVTKRVFVEGMVQGVGFRFHTQRQAAQLGVNGWVRNLEDGRVEVLIQGAQLVVTSMLEWLKKGPQRARVDKLTETAEESMERFGSFDVR